jgi:hypothetical protein
VIVREDVVYAGMTTLALYPHGVTTEEAKRLRSAGAVKRCNQNDLTCHPSPHMTRPLNRGIWQPYTKWVP